MTDAVYYTDPYAQSLDASISDIGPDYVVLDRTIFYPTGGGQPGDTGVIEDGSNSIQVVDTRKGDHGAIHHIVEDVGLGHLKWEAVSILRSIGNADTPTCACIPRCMCWVP
jgi:hypothetical protein